MSSRREFMAVTALAPAAIQAAIMAVGSAVPKATQLTLEITPVLLEGVPQARWAVVSNAPFTDAVKVADGKWERIMGYSKSVPSATS